MKTIHLAHTNKVALVDDIDFVRVGNRKWCRYGRYVGTRIGKSMVYLHRLILDAQKGDKIDHINGDPLDNRRSNLRFCTQGQNNANSKLHKRNKTGFRGVCFDKHTGKYKAKISVSRKQLNLGYFDTAEDAAHIYNVYAKCYYREFARLNIINKEKTDGL